MSAFSFLKTLFDQTCLAGISLRLLQIFCKGTYLHSNDQDARCVRKFSKLPWLHLLETGWYHKSGTETGKDTVTFCVSILLFGCANNFALLQCM